MGQEEGNQQVSRMFFKEPVQTVLLFGSKIWVLTPPRGRSLGISAQGRVMDHREASEEI